MLTLAGYMLLVSYKQIANIMINTSINTQSHEMLQCVDYTLQVEGCVQTSHGLGFSTVTVKYRVSSMRYSVFLAESWESFE